MKNIGIIILIIAFVTTIYAAIFTDASSAKIVTLAIVSIFIGMILILSDRITLIKLLGLGEIQAATEKALADAKQIESIRDEIENQKKSIDFALQEAEKVTGQLLTVNKITDELSLKTKQLEDTAQQADDLLKQIQSISEFSILLLQAKNDDRNAFDTLIQISTTINHPFQKIAGQAIENVVLDVDSMLNVRIDPSIPWAEGVDPNQLPFDRLVRNYQTSKPKLKPSLISFIWGRDDFSMYQKLDFLAYVINTDTSLRALERACRLMNKEAKLNRNIIAANEYLSWWDQNKHEFQN